MSPSSFSYFAKSCSGRMHLTIGGGGSSRPPHSLRPARLRHPRASTPWVRASGLALSNWTPTAISASLPSCANFSTGPTIASTSHLKTRLPSRVRRDPRASSSLPTSFSSAPMLPRLLVPSQALELWRSQTQGDDAGISTGDEQKHQAMMLAIALVMSCNGRTPWPLRLPPCSNLEPKWLRIVGCRRSSSVVVITVRSARESAVRLRGIACPVAFLRLFAHAGSLRLRRDPASRQHHIGICRASWSSRSIGICLSGIGYHRFRIKCLASTTGSVLAFLAVL